LQEGFSAKYLGCKEQLLCPLLRQSIWLYQIVVANVFGSALFLLNLVTILVLYKLAAIIKALFLWPVIPLPNLETNILM